MDCRRPLPSCQPYNFPLSQSVRSGVGGGEGDVIIIINNDELSYNGVYFEFLIGTNDDDR